MRSFHLKSVLQIRVKRIKGNELLRQVLIIHQNHLCISFVPFVNNGYIKNYNSCVFLSQYKVIYSCCSEVIIANMWLTAYDLNLNQIKDMKLLLTSNMSLFYFQGFLFYLFFFLPPSVFSVHLEFLMFLTLSQMNYEDLLTLSLSLKTPENNDTHFEPALIFILLVINIRPWMSEVIK